MSCFLHFTKNYWRSTVFWQLLDLLHKQQEPLRHWVRFTSFRRYPGISGYHSVTEYPLLSFSDIHYWTIGILQSIQSCSLHNFTFIYKTNIQKYKTSWITYGKDLPQLKTGIYHIYKRIGTDTVLLNSDFNSKFTLYPIVHIAYSDLNSLDTLVHYVLVGE